MCGRYTHRLTWPEIHHLYSLVGGPPPTNLQPRYNMAPTQKAPVVRQGPEGRQLAMLRWGLIPSWAKDAKIGYSGINARAETVHEKPMFRGAFKQRRCLIPANGWYEWTGEKGDKQPFVIERMDGGTLTFAGLWERWDKGSEPIESFTIIVGPASEELAWLHDRMPIVLDPEHFDAWLDMKAPQEGLRALLRPYPAGHLATRPVSRRLNTPKNDDESLLTMD